MTLHEGAARMTKFRNLCLYLLIGVGLGNLVPSIVFATDPLLITTAPNRLNSGAVDEDYKFQLTAAGGEGQLIWSESSSLPPGVDQLISMGLFISSDGLIHGVPNVSGAMPDVQHKSFKVQVTDSKSGTPNTAERVFTLTIYKNEGIRKANLEKGCFLAVEDLEKEKKWLPGDITDNISIGPAVSTQLLRYNFATEKASINAFGLGIGAAIRWYSDADIDSHPKTHTKSIHYIRPKCRATTFDNFDSTQHAAHSWVSLSPMIFASRGEKENSNSGEIDLQPAIVFGFLQDLINIGVGFNLAGANKGDVFLLMGIGTGFRF